jgi:serine/threonine protein kinase
MLSGSSRFRPGDVVGRYRLDRELGRGGMAVVFEATDTTSTSTKRRRVAVKLLLADVERLPQAVERFEREGRILQALRHQNIARVLDVGTTSDASRTLFLVIELLEGRDLRSVLEASGPLGLGDAVRYVLGAANGVAEAHRQGIVHRDLKPANLFITDGSAREESVKVLDFGVAKLLDERDGLTRASDMFGSFHFLAPELLAGSKQATPAADVWALGIVLYKALTGTVPFDRDNIGELCIAITTEPPRALRELRSDAPASLEALLARCLAKKPEDRFPDAGALASALGVIAAEVSTAPFRKPRSFAYESVTRVVPLGRELQKRSAIASMTERPRAASFAPPPAPPPPRATGGLGWALAAIATLALLAAVSAFYGTNGATFRRSVTLRVVAQPPDAFFSVDYGAQMTAPGALQIAKDDRVHLVTVWKDGYRPETREVTLGGDVTLSVDLARVGD